MCTQQILPRNGASTILFLCSGSLQEDPLPGSWLRLSCGNMPPAVSWGHRGAAASKSEISNTHRSSENVSSEVKFPQPSTPHPQPEEGEAAFLCYSPLDVTQILFLVSRYYGFQGAEYAGLLPFLSYSAPLN